MTEKQPFTPKFSRKEVARLFGRINRYTNNQVLSDVSAENNEPLSDEITDEVMAVVAMYGEFLQAQEDRRVRCIQMILAILLEDEDRIEQMRLTKPMMTNRVQNTAEVVSVQLNRMSRTK